MANKTYSYWPHMIMGFIVIGVVLGVWTVKTASVLPVSEENEYLMSYQEAELHMNDVHDAQKRFDRQYTIRFQSDKRIDIPIEHSKAKAYESSIVLKPGDNQFVYVITDKNGRTIQDANMTFLLTRPHTNKDDQRKPVVAQAENYVVEGIHVSKPGRYLLILRAQIGDAIGYLKTPAYLAP